MASQYWVYMLRCSNNHLYIGYTVDLTRRYQEHLKGINCKYTRSFKPVCLAQSWEVSNKSQALKIEHYLKKLTRKQKEQLIAFPEQLTILLSQLA